jgi:hypothetical protein
MAPERRFELSEYEAPLTSTCKAMEQAVVYVLVATDCANRAGSLAECLASYPRRLNAIE